MAEVLHSTNQSLVPGITYLYLAPTNQRNHNDIPLKF